MIQPKNLLSSQEVLSFGDAADNEILRKTIVAVIYDKATDHYLYQYWEDYHGLACLLSGGVEEEENLLTALDREIAEETGLKDYEVVGSLGGTIHSHYYKAKTNEHFVKELHPFLVVLASNASNGLRLEEDEKFVNILGTSEEVFEKMEKYESETGSTLADHKAILRRGIEYNNQQ